MALIQSLITSRCSVFCFDIHFVSQNWPQLTKHPKMTFFTIFGILIHHYGTSKLTNSRYNPFWLGHSWRFKMSKAINFQFSGSWCPKHLAFLFHTQICDCADTSKLHKRIQIRQIISIQSFMEIHKCQNKSKTKS